jgi:phosphoribosylamine---glycine ligase
MKVLIVDPGGYALDWAMRCQTDGHEVRAFIKNTEKTANIGQGLITVVRDFHPWLNWADLVFLTDNTLYLRELDAWRAKNPKVAFIGPSEAAAEWELDREVGMKVLRKHGIATPPYRVFNDYDKAIAFVKAEQRRFVSKPSGDSDKALSYCAKTPADMVYMLERWQKSGKLKGPFLLQEFIEGCEMAVGGWFGPGGWSPGWCENWEFKKLMNGDLGVATGEQGTVLRYVKTSKLARKVLEPLTDALDRLHYTGYVDVNTIIDDKGGVWPLEFTMRPGWPTFNIQQALHKGDRAEWLRDLATGRTSKNWLLDTVAAGVVMSVPDYPYSHLTRKEVVGIPVYGISPGMWPNLHLCEAMRANAPIQVGNRVTTAPTIVTAGDYVLVISGTGGTVKEATAAAYRRLKRLIVPNSPMYRTDIGARLKRQIPGLQKHGFAMNMAFSTPAPN